MGSPAEGFETGEHQCPRESQCRPLQPCNCTLPGRGPKYGPVSRQHSPLSRQPLQMDVQCFITAFTPEGESFFCCLWERALPFPQRKGYRTVRPDRFLCRLPIEGLQKWQPTPSVNAWEVSPLQVRGYQKNRNEQITPRIYPELSKTTKRSSSLLIFNSQLRECRARKTMPCSPPRTCLQRRPPGLFSLEICK